MQDMMEVGHVGCRKKGCWKGQIPYRADTGQDVCRTCRREDRIDAGQVGCSTGQMQDRTGQMHDRTDAEQVECWRRRMQDRTHAERTDIGQGEYRTGQMQDSTGVGQTGCMKG